MFKDPQLPSFMVRNCHVTFCSLLDLRYFQAKYAEILRDYEEEKIELTTVISQLDKVQENIAANSKQSIVNAESQNLHKSLTNQIENLGETVENQKLRLISLENDKHVLEQDWDQLKAGLETTTKDMNTYRNDIENLRITLDEQTKEMNELKCELDTKDLLVSTLGYEKEELMQHNQDFISAKEELIRANEELITLFDEAKTVNSALEADICRLEDELGRSQEELQTKTEELTKEIEGKAIE